MKSRDCTQVPGANDAELVRRLHAGRTVYARAWGCSMLPAVRPGERLRIEPLQGEPSRRGDIVLVASQGEIRIHRVIAADAVRVLTQGDGLRRPDPAVAPAAVVGRVTVNLDAGDRAWQRPPSRACRWFYSHHGADWWARAGRIKMRLVGRGRLAGGESAR